MSETTNKTTTATQHARTKRFALLCSQHVRHGKFRRVSPDFTNTVDAAVEKLRREITAKYPATTFSDIADVRDPNVETPVFLTKHERNAIVREVEFMIGRLIQRKVERHPTLGKTLR